MTDEYALLPYQRLWLQDKAQVKVYSKSRRIGITWATAAGAVLDAYAGKDDTWYVSHTLDGAEEFIRDCDCWCRKLGLVSDVERGWLDESGNFVNLPAGLTERGIQALRIRFESGCRVTALSSNPSRLRGKGGRVILDEFVYHPDPKALLKAAIALLMWGGTLEIISTHGGEEHLFNQIIRCIRDGEEQYQDWSLHETTFDDALEQGFARRVFQVLGKEWTPEAEAEYRDSMIRHYGVDADEELFCKPSSASAGTWFHRDNFQILDGLRDLGKPYPRVVRRVRAWDWAATVKSASNPDPDWTVGVLVAEMDNGQYLIEDVVRERLGPADVDRLLVNTAQMDGRDVEVVLAKDPGAGAKADLHHKEKLLTGYIVTPLPVTKSKDAYAKVWASIVKRGDLHILRGLWNRDYLQELHQYPSKGVHDDQVDATSYAFQALTGEGSSWSNNWLKAFDPGR